MVGSKNGSSDKTKKSSDRHIKVNGRDRRVRLPVECADRVFELMNALGHRTAGQTIEWLLSKAEPAVSAVLGRNAPPPPPPVGAVASFPLARNELQVQPALVRPKEAKMNPVHGPVMMGPGFLSGAEPEYSPTELAWVMFQASVANQRV